MPWFAELSTPTRSGSPLRSPPLLVPFYEGILGMEPEGLLASWADQPNLDEPRAGHIEGAEAFLEWVRQTHRWLVKADAAVRPVYLIVTQARTVEEVALDLTFKGERRELPVAIVAERNPDGQLTAIRVYHSLWPLTQGHEVRPPLLSHDPDLTVPDVVGDYQRALAAGDLEGILATYEDLAVVREPTGGPYVSRARRSCGASTRCCSPTVRASRWSIAPSSTTAGRAHWSTTLCSGAARRYRPKRASPSISAARAAG